MKVISEETWMKAATRGFRNPNAAKPTPMLSTTSVPRALRSRIPADQLRKQKGSRRMVECDRNQPIL
jgi:hypothetical protein